MTRIHFVSALLILASVSSLNGEETNPPVVIAKVLGQRITTAEIVASATEIHRKKMTVDEFSKWQACSQRRMLVAAIRDPLLEALAKREGLMPTKNDRERFDARQQKSGKAIRNSGVSLSNEERDALWFAFGERSTIEIRTAHALWKKQGGSIGIGSLGSCVAFEAEYRFFKEEVEAGRLTFNDTSLEKVFWEAVLDKQQRADVIIKNRVRIQEVFEQLLPMPQ